MRVRQLDGIRCIAILSVIAGHWIALNSQNSFIKNFPWTNGVILFFVLSGFLITDILLSLKEKMETGETSLKKALVTFYFRRILRIFPVYFLTILLLHFIRFKNIDELLPWLASFSTNILMAKSGNYLGEFTHFWSLAIEEQFYLFWPFLILLVNRKYLLKGICLVALLAILSKNGLFFIFHFHWMFACYFTTSLLFPLAAGALIAYYKRYNTNVFENILCNTILFYLSGIIYFLLFSICKLFAFDKLIFIFDEYVFSVFALFFVARASSSGFKSFGRWLLENKPVVYVGMLSYGLYVYHMFMYSLLNYLAPKWNLHVVSDYQLWLYWFEMLLLIASASYFLIEKPINVLKKYRPY